MTAWTVITAAVPDSLEDPGAWGLHGAAAVSRATDLATYGHDDLAYTARYLHAKLRETGYYDRRRLVAVPPEATSPSADDVVGTAALAMPLTDNQHLAYLQVGVHPAHLTSAGAARGVDDVLLEHAEQLAAAAGRTTVLLDSEHGAEPSAGEPGVLEPPTGSGRIRASDAGARLAERHGYALEQAERYSVLDLPVDGDLLTRLHDDAVAHAGADYRLVHWTDRTPSERLADFALLETRMSTDVPLAGLDVTEDRWDGDRVRTYERSIADTGHGYLLVAAEHVPSGALAAFTMVEYPLDQREVVFQEDTLVLREHRGRRLGMLVKTALLQQLAEVRPGARRVHTWNAEENAHMLGINVALGFEPRGVAGQWQKRLA